MGSQGGEARGAELEGKNKRVGGGEQEGWGRVFKFLNSPAPPPPKVWALDLPRIHPVKVTRGLVCIKQPMHL